MIKEFYNQQDLNHQLILIQEFGKSIIGVTLILVNGLQKIPEDVAYLGIKVIW